MLRRLFRWLPVLGLTLLIGGLEGCGFGTGLPCPIPTEMNNFSEERIAFTLQNDTCMSICSFNISPRACDDWGPEWLESRPIHSGESVSLYLPPGRYDALFEYCTQATFMIEKVDVGENDTLTISGSTSENTVPCDTSLTVVNQSDVPICHMWIATEVSQQFGRNWLRGEQLPPGESRTFFVQPDTYDIKAEDCDFNLLRVELDVRVSGHQTWTVP